MAQQQSDFHVEHVIGDGMAPALGPAELEAGYVLTCQAHPASPTVTVDYDAP